MPTQKMLYIMRPIFITSFWAAIVAAFIVTPSPAFANSDSFQDTKILDAIVAAQLGSEIGAPGGARSPVDRRLKLSKCPVTPTVSNGQMDAVIVRCKPLGWRIRVPINISDRNSLVPGSATTAQAGGVSMRYAPNNAASREIAIRRGEPVRLTIRKRGFSLSRVMIADSNGRIGDIIPVRADRRERPIMVRITDVGEAALMM